MDRHSQQIYFSPSDLVRFMDSPFATWMDRFKLDYPDQAPAQDEPDAMMGLLAQQGHDHEQQLIDRWQAQGYQITYITGNNWQEKRQATQQAMANGHDIIVQAALQHDAFHGFADFLIKTNHPDTTATAHYEVWDAKLAALAKPAFIIQLCAYSDMLQHDQGTLPEHITLILGDGQITTYRTAQFFYYYQQLKNAFLAQQVNFDPQNQPDPSSCYQWADWESFAKACLIDQDHLSQVANITKSQIKKLQQAGITTMRQLAHLSPSSHVPRLNPSILSRLQQQAAIQHASGHSDQVLFEIIQPDAENPKGLALLPPASDYDVFFDIEGDPLQPNGLEYLWGASYFDDHGQRVFKDFWAHDTQEEKQAFQAFIQWVYQRWQTDPNMHIYHYANYEIAACRKLMGRYGVCEFELDQLLRHNVFVDLYHIVKTGLLVGQPRYSIKNIEHLYRGHRQTEVGNGSDSVVVYERWRTRYAKGLTSKNWQHDADLRAIRDYNIDDCDSTQELVDWLREQQQAHGIVFTGNQVGDVSQQAIEKQQQSSQLCQELLQLAETQRHDDPDTAQVTETLAWMTEFHRREAKPVFWRQFDRLAAQDVELLDDLDCLANCQRTSQPPFAASQRARNLVYEYAFDTEQNFKAAAKQYFVKDTETDQGYPIKVTFEPTLSDLSAGRIALKANQEPPEMITLVPDEFVSADIITSGIKQVARAHADGTLAQHHPAIVDFLYRSKPRVKNHQGPLAPEQSPEAKLKAILKIVANLDHSYLTIQGPPGAGKSFTGKQIIAERLRHGAAIGITSNSHKAINHLLKSTAAYCREQGIQAQFFCTKETDESLSSLDIKTLKTNQLQLNSLGPCVIGTTAWGFARDDMAKRLDYLIVDEAGQVSAANLVGISRCADNLILMGDQMQLGQPIQGSHPGESGLSVLDYLVHDTATIRDDMGVFLATTFRLHSRINHLLSQQIYDGQLISLPANDHRILEIPEHTTDQCPIRQQAGIVFLPIEHQGNTQSSPEEIDCIVKTTQQLLGRTFHTGLDLEPTRPITWDDILFVAPYNHQVRQLKDALGPQAHVGSVDKFQGQEAPIVFLSLCASDANDSPRGIDFLFDPNRLNVALSRAQTLAIVVGNPALGQTQVNHVDQLKKVNLLNAIMHEHSAT